MRAITALRGDEPCGYAIYRPDGLLLDLLVRPTDRAAFLALHRALIERLRGHGATQIVATAPGVPWLLGMYFDAGYQRWQRWQSGIFCVKGTADAVPKRMMDPEAWYLSAADSDLHTFKMRSW